MTLPLPLTIAGTTYPSQADAARAIGITKQAASARAAVERRGRRAPGRPRATPGACGCCGEVTAPPHNRRTCPRRPDAPPARLRLDVTTQPTHKSPTAT